jgi:hypothetical protein
MTTLSFHYGGQTIQYSEDDCFSCDTGVTTVKMSNVSEQRMQEVSACAHCTINECSGISMKGMCSHALTHPGPFSGGRTQNLSSYFFFACFVFILLLDNHQYTITNVSQQLSTMSRQLELGMLIQVWCIVIFDRVNVPFSK